MKIFTIIYRKLTRRCIYCGMKKKCYHVKMHLCYYCCPSDWASYIESINIPRLIMYNTGCSTTKKFITYKEAKIQRALGLL